MEAVRSATEADLSVLGSLARAALEEQREARGGGMFLRREAREEPVERSLRAAVGSGAHRVVVGTIDDVVVGYAVAHLEELRTGEPLAVLEDLFVLPGARGVGVGEVLMGDVLQWARDRRCVGIDALVLPGNRQSKNFFEAFGLVARAIVVHRPLGS